MDPETEKQDELAGSSPDKEQFIEDLRQAEAQAELDSRLDKILDRKFDLHIVPWLFGIWLVTDSVCRE
jgi:hypothetical protein